MRRFVVLLVGCVAIIGHGVRDATACSPFGEPQVGSPVPADGSVDVPIDVLPRVNVTYGLADHAALTLTLADSTGAPVVGVQGEVAAGGSVSELGSNYWVSFAPGAGLAANTGYSFVATVTTTAGPESTTVSSFTTGDRIADSPPVGPALLGATGWIQVGSGKDCNQQGLVFVTLRLDPLTPAASSEEVWTVHRDAAPLALLRPDGFFESPAVFGVEECYAVAVINAAGAAGAPGPVCCFELPEYDPECDVAQGIGCTMLPIDLVCSGNGDTTLPDVDVTNDGLGCAVDSVSTLASPSGWSVLASVVLLALALRRRE